MLEIGCGSGFIVDHFSKLGYGPENSYAVDVRDERQIKDSFQSQHVNDVTLPFNSETFEFIITNHVIEHFGKVENQKKHLKENYRCLEEEGILYFAVPNRWLLIELHYKLPFLNWLP